MTTAIDAAPLVAWRVGRALYAVIAEAETNKFV